MMRYLFLLCISLFVIACHQEPVEIQPAFYYWKNIPKTLSNAEKAALEEQQTQKLYLRFFELKPHPEFQAVPVNKISLQANSINSDVEIIPTIFIRNEVFKNIEVNFIDTLAQKTLRLIEKYHQERFVNSNFTEIQMDCDWTVSTKAAYFQFLKNIKQQTDKKVSVTLRLYPYKYTNDMGVPPVDRAMLMCYNLLNPLKAKDKNSILDLETLKAYLHPRQDYPLPLDIALPIFSWMQFYHYGQFQGLIYPEHENIKDILIPERPLWYKVKQDTSMGEYYLREGDEIKYEEVPYPQLEAVVELIKKYVDLEGKTTVALFHLDDKNLNYYETKLPTVYSLFTKSRD
jgi:hypothetical protein